MKDAILFYAGIGNQMIRIRCTGGSGVGAWARNSQIA